MDYTHIQKNIQSSPRKLRLVAEMVRKMKPQEALDVLQFTNQAAAVPLLKAIKTALANAKKDDALFKSLEINEGMKLKRYRAGTAGRGRGRPYKRRWAHIKIVLTDEVSGKAEKELKNKKSNIKMTNQNEKRKEEIQEKVQSSK